MAPPPPRGLYVAQASSNHVANLFPGSRAQDQLEDDSRVPRTTRLDSNEAFQANRTNLSLFPSRVGPTQPQQPHGSNQSSTRRDEAPLGPSRRQRATRVRQSQPPPESLADRIVKLFVKSTFDGQSKDYLPEGCLHQIMDKPTIMAELRKGKAGLGAQPEEEEDILEDISQWILEKSIKVFAITLQCSDQAEFITQAMDEFMDVDFQDSDLPIDDPQLPNEPPESIQKAFHSWRSSPRYQFFDKQWTTLVPIFDPRTYEYNMLAQCIMPFERRNIRTKGGAFSSVYRVRVHPSHMRHDGLQDVAIKQIVVNNDSDPVETDKAWEIEARALSVINTLDHESIVKCIAAIRRGNSRYFMFPWADGGSLRDFWNEIPKQAPSADMIRQMIEQLRALSDVLDWLHNIDRHQPDSTSDEDPPSMADRDEIPKVQVLDDEDNEVNDYLRATRGGSLRHGDLKPENILRFCYNHSGWGQLKIADMGLAKRHMLATQERGEQPTSMRYGTSRYEAPEATENTTARSRLYDIWSMGCVTLEFIIWTLYGNDQLKRFYAQVSIKTGQEWQYYELDPQVDGKRAYVNKEVERWIDHLENYDPECRKGTVSALSDLLRVVRENLLVVHLPPNRESSLDSGGGGRTLQPEMVSLSGTHFRATAAEFREALDQILEKSKNLSYLFTGKDRSRIPSTSAKRELLNAKDTVPEAASKESLSAGTLSTGIIGPKPGPDYSLPPLEDWTFHVDNVLAEQLFGTRSSPSTIPTSTNLCNSCSKLNFWSPSFSLEYTALDLEERGKSCRLCKMLWDAYHDATGPKPNRVRFERSQSVITMSGHRFPVLSIFRSPGLNPPLAIQLGLPVLSRSGSVDFFSTIKMWLKDCDGSHPGCVGIVQCCLPTRLIEVGTVDQPLLRLVETKEEKVASNDYVALSHPWGDTSIYSPFSTLRRDPENGYDLDNYKSSIPFDKLPATFKDAVIFTRQIGVPYIWIDSICILQGPDGDFADEAKRMEDVFSGAYCVIAASRAVDQRSGFLSQARTQGEYVTFLDKGKPFYVCKTIDNFNKDVIEGSLNKRGWVLQERALARRTIYLTDTQAYFECGNGVRCETLTRMQNNMADFLGDPRFPEKAMRTKSRALKIKYFQDLYKRYTSLDFTRCYDRPFAIAGLERRLHEAFNSKGNYGIFDDSDKDNPGLFRRSLLWQRHTDDDTDTPLKVIEFPTDRKVQIPSWSWMAYEGRITYFDPNFRKADWETEEIVSPWCEQTSSKSAPQTPDVALTVTVRDFDLRGRGQNEVKLVYDTDRTTASDGKRTQCVVVARSIEGRSDREKWFYVLLVGATGGHTSRGHRVYKRVGAGCMLGRYIKLDADGVVGKVF